MRTIEWRGDHAVLIDQTRLPHEIVWLDVRDVDTMIDAIRRLAIRGRAGDRRRRRVRRRPRRPAGRARGSRRGVRPRRGGSHRRRPADGGQPLVGRASRRRPARRGRGSGRRRGGRAVRGGRAHEPGACRTRRGTARGAVRTVVACAHTLQHGRAGDRRVGDGARHRPRPARGRAPGIGDCRRDEAAAAGFPAHGVRARRSSASITGSSSTGQGRRSSPVASPMPSSSAPTGSPPTATSPTRSGRTRWRWPQRVPASRSSSPRRSRRSTSTRRREMRSRSRSATATRSWRSVVGAWRPRDRRR